jgi:predicted nucleic acid-binding protein
VLRGRPAADRLRGLRSTDELPWICAINAEEVWRGLRPGEEAAASRLLSGLRFAPLGGPEAERAGRWRRDYSSQGTTLSQADCLIAAATLAVRARLATGNPKDFPMEELEVEYWPASGLR